MTLNKKRILVVGGAQGLGFRIASRICTHGGRVALIDIGCDTQGEHPNPEVVAEACRALTRVHHQNRVSHDSGSSITSDRVSHDSGTQEDVLSFFSDVNDEREVVRCIDEIYRAWGGLDGAVYAAGVYPRTSLIRTSLSMARKTIDTHVLSPWFVLKILSERWIASRVPGSMVMFGGNEAFLGAQRQMVLAASYAACMGLVRGAATELRKHGIRVNLIAPFGHARATRAAPLFESVGETAFDDTLTVDTVVAMLDDANTLSGEIIGVTENRLYTFRIGETPGVYLNERPLSPDALRQTWPQIIKP